MQESPIHLIHSFKRSNDEEVQIHVKEYNNKHYVDLRIWFKTKSDPILRPTKKGISFSLNQLKEFREGVSKLLKSADNFKPQDGLEI